MVIKEKVKSDPKNIFYTKICLYKVYQNQFINECARKNLGKIHRCL